jgi:endo-1,4-beta-xylanase
MSTPNTRPKPIDCGATSTGAGTGSRVWIPAFALCFSVVAACVDGSSGADDGTGATGAMSGAGGSTAGASNVGGTSAGKGGTANGGSAGKGGSAGSTAGAGGAGKGGTGAAGNGGSTAGTAGSVNAGDKFVGNITTGGQVRSDFADYWTQITPENEGKWGSVEPNRDQMNWSALDRIHDYANQNGLLFKQHTFVWGSQQPGWVAQLSPADQAAEVEEWIRLFCERYPDVDLIDVVNEPPPHTTPSYLSALGGAGESGYDWIIQAFRWARQYCPNATLILNDYNVLRYDDADHFIEIANAVKGSGLVDALGSQSHDHEDQPLDDLQMRLNNLIAVGLPIYITEYDVSTTDDELQRRIYEEQFPLFWSTPEIKGITIWGYVYGETWSQAPDSGLIRNGQPRPAMTWLMNFLGR